MHDDWDETLDEFLKTVVDEDRLEAWGNGDTAANAFVSQTKQLTTLDLYGTAPDCRHPNPAGAALVGADGFLEKWIYTWDQYSLGQSANIHANAKEPSWRIVEALKDGSTGDDVSNVFLVDGEGKTGALTRTSTTASPTCRGAITTPSTPAGSGTTSRNAACTAAL